ncbi:MAG: transposase, partial [Prochlorococcaceae cyanobacterium]
MATDHEISHGRDITWTLRAKPAPEHIAQAWIGSGWIVEVAATGTRDGKPFQATHLYCFTRRTSRCDTSLRTTPEALLHLVRDRWSIECWHWIRDTQLHEDDHR